jgi:hypothetical protein
VLEVERDPLADLAGIEGEVADAPVADLERVGAVDDIDAVSARGWYSGWTAGSILREVALVPDDECVEIPPARRPVGLLIEVVLSRGQDDSAGRPLLSHLGGGLDRPLAQFLELLGSQSRQRTRGPSRFSLSPILGRAAARRDEDEEKHYSAASRSHRHKLGRPPHLYGLTDGRPEIRAGARVVPGIA